MKAIDAKGQVRVGLVEGLTTFLGALKKKRCSISTKTEIIGNVQQSRQWLVRKLKRYSSEFSFQQARSSRDLAIDASAGARRTVKVQRNRIRVAKLRGKLFHKLTKIGRGPRSIAWPRCRQRLPGGFSFWGSPQDWPGG